MACGSCGSEDATRPLCTTCTGRLEWMLAETDALCTELTTTVTRQAKTRSTGNAPSGEKPLPFHHGASEAYTALRSTLKNWSGWVLGKLADEHIYARPPLPATPERLATFLLAWVDWLSRRDEAPAFYAELVDRVRRAQTMVDNAPDMVTLGPCGATHEGQECTEPLRAVAGRPEVTCRTCGNTWDVQERRDWMLGQARTVTITALEASRMFPDTAPHQVNNWRKRGHLDTAGTHNGQHVYHLSHVHRLVRLRATGAKLSNINPTPKDAA